MTFWCLLHSSSSWNSLDAPSPGPRASGLVLQPPSFLSSCPSFSSNYRGTVALSVSFPSDEVLPRAIKGQLSILDPEQP